MMHFRLYLTYFVLILAWASSSLAHASCQGDILPTGNHVAVRLLITSELSHITSRSTRQTTSRLTYVEGPGRARRLDLMKAPLNIPTGDDVSVSIRVARPRGPVLTIDDLPPALLHRLGLVLRGAWDFRLADCASLAVYLAGVDILPIDRFATSAIVLDERVGASELEPGDLVGIENDERTKVHLDIFLTPQSGGLYLSKFGDWKGPLEVTTLRQMINFYGAHDLHRYYVAPK